MFDCTFSDRVITFVDIRKQYPSYLGTDTSRVFDHWAYRMKYPSVHQRQKLHFHSVVDNSV